MLAAVAAAPEGIIAYAPRAINPADIRRRQIVPFGLGSEAKSDII